MTDVSFAMEAKSDQLNAMDIIGDEGRIIRIRAVEVKQGNEQPVWVYFDGDNSRPWKPSKGMIRILAGAWGKESSAWVGRSAHLYCDPDVMYAGKKVGGIRIRALSDIDKNGARFSITINRQKREPFQVQYLDTTRPTYPEDKFASALPTMIEKMQNGEMTLQQIISRCQQTGDLTADQLAKLEENAPKDIELTEEDEF